MALPGKYREVMAAVTSDAALLWVLAFLGVQLLILYWSLAQTRPIRGDKRTKKNVRSDLPARSTVPDKRQGNHKHVKRPPASEAGKRHTWITKSTKTPDATSDTEVRSNSSDSKASNDSRQQRLDYRHRYRPWRVALNCGSRIIGQWAARYRHYAKAAACIALLTSLLRAWHLRLPHQLFDVQIDKPTAQTVRPSPSLILYGIDNVLRTHASIPSADLFEVNTTMINGVPGAPTSLSRLVFDMYGLFRDGCGLVTLSYSSNRDDETLRRARIGLEAECAMVMRMTDVTEAARHITAIETTLSSAWPLEALGISNEILAKVKALGPVAVCRDGDDADHQQCSRLLLDALRGMVEQRAARMDELSSDLESHLGLALEAIHTIRNRVPIIDMLVGTIAQGAAQDVANARAFLQGVSWKGRSWRSGFWTKKKPPVANDTHDRDRDFYKELLRAVHAPVALQHLDSMALEPFERVLNRTHFQVRDQAMPGWKRLRHKLKAMSAHPIPKVAFIYHASSRAPEVVVTGPLGPTDGVWVDGSVVRYLPPIPRAVQILTTAAQELETIEHRTTYEISLAQHRTLVQSLDPNHPRSSFDFGNWDAKATEADNKESRPRVEELREALKNGTLTFVVNGRNATIKELNVKDPVLHIAVNVHWRKDGGELGRGIEIALNPGWEWLALE
ncbi:hypothetical protein QBC34DRAFT_454573 [Podospora aff. communis PSN243]|uniref:Uncharacterized protein n=1 Tax=Podospora aff. communis PSN243 TaxID=3040156 RepID=A0AAV9G5K7_9PEZI|nr:hypothetical protein QBC34DRAFT_454573 [Podospora aff. communis PSN243]